MDVKISPRWKELLGAEFEKPYFAELVRFVKQEYATRRVFPAGRNIFHAFDMCDPDDIKVVVIGQDPYHGEGQAHGLCFSVNDGVPFPPSLVNIFQEVRDDTGAAVPASGNLDRWASQGVLLPDAVVRAIAAHRDRVVYMLWGSYAQRKGAIVDPARNCILKAVHPSPLSAYRGFFGCRHFSQANAYLEANGRTPVVW